jgi:hypothetical protein
MIRTARGCISEVPQEMSVPKRATVHLNSIAYLQVRQHRVCEATNSRQCPQDPGTPREGVDDSRGSEMVKYGKQNVLARYPHSITHSEELRVKTDRSDMPTTSRIYRTHHPTELEIR